MAVAERPVSPVLDRCKGCISQDGCIGMTQAAACVGVTRQRVSQAISAGKLKAIAYPRYSNGEHLFRQQTLRTGTISTQIVWRIRPEDLVAWREAATSRD